MYTLTLLFGAFLPTAHGADGPMVSIVAHTIWDQSGVGWSKSPSNSHFTEGDKVVRWVSGHVRSQAKEYLAQHPHLTDEEAMAIKMYTDNNPKIFGTVNKVLGWGKHQKHASSLKTAVSDFSGILLRALHHAGLTKHGELYRGIPDYQPYANMRVGETIEETGYMSTSLKKSVTEKSFYKGAKGTSVTILGGVGLEIPNCLGNKSESEVLIPPTSRFQIVKSKMVGQTHQILLRFLGASTPVHALSVRIQNIQVSEPKRRKSPSPRRRSPPSLSTSASSSPVHSGNSSSSRSEIESMGYSQLKAFAKENDIDLSSSKPGPMKRQIISFLDL